jgi:DNA-directed RNA polymerase specialized sigma24 family protein
MAHSIDATSYDPLVLARLVQEAVLDDHDLDDAAKRVTEVVSAILSVLPETDRAVVEMCLMAGISQREAASQLGITRGALRRSLERSVPLMEGLCGLFGIAPIGDKQ